jgi:DNA-binding LytR/AlgR family response regulator
MSKIRILIIEDELIIAENMKKMLHELGYEVTGIACDKNEAIQLLDKKVPDIALVDIKLRHGDDGIELAESIKEEYNIPVVFISSFSDKETIERAKYIKPGGYIVKPFEKKDLYSSIEIALFNYSEDNTGGGNTDIQGTVIKDSIFIKKDYVLIKIKFAELQWIKSDGNYLELYCQENKHLIRSSIKEFIKKLPDTMFIQIHKSYCINISYISKIDHSSVWLKNTRLPIGRSFIGHIKSVLNIEI